MKPIKPYSKLSEAQKRVIDLMMDDKDSFVEGSKYYNFQKIRRPNISDKYFDRPTLRVLITLSILIPDEEFENTYLINPEFKYDKIQR